MTTLDIMRDWIERRLPVLEASGVTVTVTWAPPHRAPAGAWVDFEAGQRSARLTLWANGEADLVVGDGVTREVLLEEHREISTTLGLDDVERTVMAWLRPT